jgi:hypothetical protein
MTPAHFPSPKHVWDYFSQMETALEFARNSALTAGEHSPYAAWTDDEVDAHFGRLAHELHQWIVLMLAASFEALFHLDFTARVRKRLKDPVTKGMRRLSTLAKRHKHRRIELDQVLDVWNEMQPSARNAIGEFRQLMEYRHWLAHGRYWNQKSGLRSIEPLEAWRRGVAVLAAASIALVPATS